jgi:hypothetical protein
MKKILSTGFNVTSAGNHEILRLSAGVPGTYAIYVEPFETGDFAITHYDCGNLAAVVEYRQVFGGEKTLLVAEIHGLMDLVVMATATGTSGSTGLRIEAFKL